MTPTRSELRLLWESVPDRTGWDFTRLRVERAPVPWVYEGVVRSLLEGDERVLDIGTGGGERLLRLAESFASGVGIDLDPEMVDVANGNAVRSSQQSVSFRVASAGQTGAGNSEFDCVLNRHSVVDVGEVGRVLNPGGLFVTQQVGDRNLKNLLEPFGGQEFGNGNDDQAPEKIRDGLVGLGFAVERFEEYDVEYRFLDTESLLFQINAISDYLANEFDEEAMFAAVEQAVAVTADDPGGYVSNEHRWLVVARKTG